ncbi:hypothetical protein E1263_22625 [Kribbella antibiotica]|uniref:Uncharacterized protein n=1 Tax=Kribbella antibiotica TaxID=190195 RepID=A0A4R4ZHW9_9ACTN|nr:hypothetical protein [Kribbella antibiotica]TDD57690.1 hypothetical protein E1263_22625 [Kribbella antibiotica]
MYNWNEHALRIRPSQGDFGIDVIVPTSHTPARWDVYQVKKFATNLDTNQKAQIDKSFRRVLIALVRGKVPLNDWYLVTPLDPTLNNLQDWFEETPARAVEALAEDSDLEVTAAELDTINEWLEAPDRIIAWKGLNFCETLAGDYPRVIDYYLHGGRDRLRDAVADLAALLRVDSALRVHDSAAPGEGSAAVLEPGDIRDHLSRLDRVLDTDPHFRYGYSLDLRPPDLHSEPRLVAATQEQISDDRWLTVKIYARSPQSLEERPIPMKLEFSFEDDDEDRAAFETWRKYGKPFEGAASFSVRLPGGLSTDGEVGRIRLSPAAVEGAVHRRRLRIVDPDGTSLAELTFTMSSATGLDRTGSWGQGSDESGVLSAEFLLDGTALSGTCNFTLAPVAGLDARKVLPALRFAAALTTPNTLQASTEYGPFRDFSAIPAGDPLAEPALAGFVEDLDTIQTVTNVPVQVPDVEILSSEDIRQIRRAASLIRGKTSVGSWTDLTFEKHEEIALNPGDHYQISLFEPLSAPINSTTLPLGYMDRTALSAQVDSVDGNTVRIVPHSSDAVYSNFAPELPAELNGQRAVRFRPAEEPQVTVDTAE